MRRAGPGTSEKKSQRKELSRALLALPVLPEIQLPGLTFSSAGYRLVRAEVAPLSC